MTSTEQFKLLVREFVDIDEQIRQAQKAVTPLRKRKTELSKDITDFMKQNDISVCDLRDGAKLVVKRAKSVQSLNKDAVAVHLSDSLGKDKAEELAANIWKNRPVKYKDTLKIARDMEDDDAEDDDAEEPQA